MKGAWAERASEAMKPFWLYYPPSEVRAGGACGVRREEGDTGNWELGRRAAARQRSKFGRFKVCFGACGGLVRPRWGKEHLSCLMPSPANCLKPGPFAACQLWK